MEPAPAGSTSMVVNGDSRRAIDDLSRKDFNWSIFSPPYPNNIDYTEVYKLEGWVLGFYTNADDLREQRLSTLRSHPSVRFPDIYLSGQSDLVKAMGALVQPMLDVIPKGRYELGRVQLVKGYFDDMLRVFQSIRRHMALEGRVACVVGNSVHATGTDQFVIASDLVLAAVGELAGFRVDEIRIARQLHRRGRGLRMYVRA